MKYFYICYEMPELTGGEIHRAGPYTAEDVNYHLADIRGYAEVARAHLRPTDNAPPHIVAREIREYHDQLNEGDTL